MQLAVVVGTSVILSHQFVSMITHIAAAEV